MAERRTYSEHEWEENEQMWFELTSAWRQRAEKAEASAAVLLAALGEAYAAMNRMGDMLNEADMAVGDPHFDETSFAFAAVRAALEEGVA